MSNALPVIKRSDTFRADIQGIRGIAIILVVALHLNLSGFAGGYIGVDIFFVVSGYVITLSILKKPQGRLLSNLASFWRSRFIRIFPAAALVVCVTIVSAYYLQGLAFNSDLFADARWATLYATNFRLIFTGSNYFIAGLDQSLLTHYWSLAVEQQFYLVYPVILFTLGYISVTRVKTIAIRVVLVAVVISSSLWSIYQTQLDPVSAYFSPFTRFWELAFGGLLATFGVINRVKWLPYLGLIGILGCLFILNVQSVYPGYLAWLPVLFTGMLLIAPLNLLGTKPLRYLGDISYSLYLWHFLWLVLPTQLENPITDENMKWVFLIGALVTAVITYHFFEGPIHRAVALKNDRFSALSVAVICLAGSWAVIALIENIYLRATL